MVDSEYSSDNYKTLKISIGAIIKDPEMLRLVLDYLKNKKMSKNAIKKLPFLIRCVPDRYETKEICDKVNVYSGLLQRSKNV